MKTIESSLQSSHLVMLMERVKINVLLMENYLLVNRVMENLVLVTVEVLEGIDLVGLAERVVVRCLQEELRMAN